MYAPADFDTTSNVVSSEPKRNRLLASPVNVKTVPSEARRPAAPCGRLVIATDVGAKAPSGPYDVDVFGTTFLATVAPGFMNSA